MTSLVDANTRWMHACNPPTHSTPVPHAWEAAAGGRPAVVGPHQPPLEVSSPSPGRLQAKGYMIWQHLQTCARMKELTLGIQNHIGFMGLRRRGAELRASGLLIGNCFIT